MLFNNIFIAFNVPIQPSRDEGLKATKRYEISITIYSHITARLPNNKTNNGFKILLLTLFTVNKGFSFKVSCYGQFLQVYLRNK